LKPRVPIDRTATQDGRELVLLRRDDAFFIDVDGHELMSSRAHGSETALARLAIQAARRGKIREPRVLVGGLGMGFTLRAVLDELGEAHSGSGEGGKVVVAELFPEIVEWNRGPLGTLAGHPLKDRRVAVEVGDVGRHSARRDAYDVILLDVDNGPESFTVDTNRGHYTRSGLERWFQALPPKGVLAVWSAHQEPQFEGRMRSAGFQVTTHSAAARKGGKGGRHTIFVGVKPGGSK
jgi:spermidine synthase